MLNYIFINLHRAAVCFFLGIVVKGRPFMHFSIEAFFVKKPFLNTSAIFNFWFTVFFALFFYLL